MAQRFAGDVRHREPAAARRLPGVVHRQDVGMLEPCGEPDLALEPLGAERDGKLGLQHLQGHRPVVLEILREIHAGHPATPELTLEDVVGAKGVGELDGAIGHGGNYPATFEGEGCRTRRNDPGSGSRAGHLVPMPAGKRFVPVSQWRDGRHRRGLRGELAALAYLTACGWSIEAHRFRLGRHDVDLVARRERVVAFVEVKSRGSARCGAAAEAVSPRKRVILARVAACWLARYGRRGDVCRFDLVSVREGTGRTVVDHMPDAWRILGGSK